MSYPEKSNKLTWSNDDIAIGFQPWSDFIKFSILNKTDNAIKIVWDDAAIIIDGVSTRALHGNESNKIANQHRVPTSIPPGSVIVDQIFPVGYIYIWDGFDDNGQYVSAKLYNIPMFPAYDFEYKLFDGHLPRPGREYRLYLPIVVNGVVKNYIFGISVSYRAEDGFIDKESNKWIGPYR
jgi:hypothetical protein